jgi:DNA-binding IclR family transcriptional regulator
LDQAVFRAFQILETVLRARDSVRLADLAADVELQKSTVHRILQTLAAMGYVVQEPSTRRYRATLKAWELGSAALDAHPVKRAAAPFLQELHRLTGETVSMTVMEGDDVLYLDKIISPRPVRFTTRAGSRVAAILTAGGQAMLALEPDARAVVERTAQRLVGVREIDVETVLAALETVRARGYAISRSNPDVVSIGGAILGEDGRAAGALSVSAPHERTDAEKQAAIIESVRVTCTRMAETLGRL